MRSIEFWYEFASTYSYPAAMCADENATRHGVRVRWQPFLLGPIFKDLGWTTSPFNLQPAKGVYMWRDVQRTCEDLGLAFHRPKPFPQNSLLAARVALGLPDDGTRARFSRAVFAAQFAVGSQIAEPSIIAGILKTLDRDPDMEIEKAQGDAAKDDVRKQVARAVTLGIFGAPTFVTADQELFWGYDRLDAAMVWASKVNTTDSS